jgi:oligopeptide transport system substrate-binding protein
MDELGIPQSVRVAIQSRMRVLPADTQETLRLAAVLGREFDFDTLVEASELDEDTLIDGLESAERAQLIEEVSGEGGGTFAFVHALIPSTLVEGLRTLQRRRLHRQVAAAIETLHPDDDSHLEALAYHHTYAGKAEKAIKYLLQVGDRARGLYAHQEAIVNYQQALEFLKEQEEHEQAARTLMKLGLTYHTTFDFQQSRQAYAEGFALWQRAGEDQEVALPPAPHAFRADWLAGEALTTLDPAVDVHSVLDQLFSGLVELSADMDVAPDVAQSWEVLEGGRKYIFHLRGDALWSDGTPVTAGDFEYAWKRVLDPSTGASYAELLYDVRGAKAFHRGEGSGPNSVGIQALDEVTLVVELEEPTGYFLYLLAHSICYPVPRRVVEMCGEAWATTENIVTNGPFKLETWQQGESMVLSRNLEYHGRFRGNVQQVNLPVLRYEEWSARLAMYEADSLDTLDITFFPAAEMNNARQRYAGEYISVPTLTTRKVEFDASRPPFDDPRVRRAFVLAADKETLVDVIMDGWALPATGGFVPPGMSGHSAGIGLPYDPDQARRLLAEAGYPKGGGSGFPVVELLIASGPLASAPCECLQAQWRENLRVEIAWEEVKWVKLSDRLRIRRPHMLITGWGADYLDPDNFLRVGFLWIQKQVGWRNDVYDRLIEEARRIADPEERMRLYRQADRILVEEAVIMPFCYERRHLLIKPWVRKCPLSAIRGLFWKDVIIEPH